jgi:hypothetical protein
LTNPWFKFYPADWKADDQLKLCSASARGLWVEMLCICHHATPYGHLLINGQPPTDTQLSVLTGIALEEITRLMGELQTREIFSRTAKGVIYSRKMVRDAQKASEGRKYGKKGGNPKLCKDSEKSPTLNPKDKAGVNTQKPEAREELVYEAQVIRLKEETFEAWRADTNMTAEQFALWLDEQDGWIKKLPGEKQAKWVHMVKAQIRKMKAA